MGGSSRCGGKPKTVEKTDQTNSSRRRVAKKVATVVNSKRDGENLPKLGEKVHKSGDSVVFGTVLEGTDGG